MRQKKMKSYDIPQKIEALGLYPYFRTIESEQDTVVKINGVVGSQSKYKYEKLNM